MSVMNALANSDTLDKNPPARPTFLAPKKSVKMLPKKQQMY